MRIQHLYIYTVENSVVNIQYSHAKTTDYHSIY